ncbi:MAG: LysR family transcriptional regulator [Acetobacteraceae bacterium]
MAGPSLRQLRTFLAVVESGSVSAAARALNMTQPAASQQLRELERCLRVRLLDRANGRSVPTAAGAALLDPARRAQAAIEDAVATADAFRSGETARVRLGTGATACIHLLPAVLAEARRRMPGMDIVIATGNSAGIVRRVESGELDIGLVTMRVAPNRALQVTRLLADPLVALIPAAMAETGEWIGPARLAALPLILYEPGGSTRVLIDGWFRAAGVTPAPIMELDSVETIKVLVGGGLGASVLPSLALRAPVDGTVTRRLRPGLSRHLGVVLRRDKVMDRGMQVMRDALARAAS